MNLLMTHSRFLCHLEMILLLDIFITSRSLMGYNKNSNPIMNSLGLKVIYLYFRTFKKELIYMNVTSDARNDLVLTHLGVFENSIRVEEIDYEFEFVTSCVTLMSNSQVPAGKKHNVMKIVWCHLNIAKQCTIPKWSCVLINIIVSAWHVFQCK